MFRDNSNDDKDLETKIQWETICENWINFSKYNLQLNIREESVTELYRKISVTYLPRVERKFCTAYQRAVILYHELHQS